MNMRKFFGELNRRNVYNVAGQQVSGIEIRSLGLIRLVKGGVSR